MNKPPPVESSAAFQYEPQSSPQDRTGQENTGQDRRPTVGPSSYSPRCQSPNSRLETPQQGTRNNLAGTEGGSGEADTQTGIHGPRADSSRPGQDSFTELDRLQRLSVDDAILIYEADRRIFKRQPEIDRLAVECFGEGWRS